MVVGKLKSSTFTLLEASSSNGTPIFCSICNMFCAIFHHFPYTNYNYKGNYDNIGDGNTRGNDYLLNFLLFF